MDLKALAEEVLGEVAAGKAADSGDERLQGVTSQED